MTDAQAKKRDLQATWKLLERFCIRLPCDVPCCGLVIFNAIAADLPDHILVQIARKRDFGEFHTRAERELAAHEYNKRHEVFMTIAAP